MNVSLGVRLDFTNRILLITYNFNDIQLSILAIFLLLEHMLSIKDYNNDAIDISKPIYGYVTTDISYQVHN